MILDGRPNKVGVRIARGVIETVVSSRASDVSKPNSEEKACCFLSRTPPSTMSSTSFEIVRVTPAVTFKPCFFANAVGVVAPVRSVTSSFVPVVGSTRRAPGNPSF